MENNKVSIKKSTIWKGTAVALIAVLVFFAFKGNFGQSPTGKVVAADPYANLSFREICAKTGGM